MHPLGSLHSFRSQPTRLADVDALRETCAIRMLHASPTVFCYFCRGKRQDPRRMAKNHYPIPSRHADPMLFLILSSLFGHGRRRKTRISTFPNNHSHSRSRILRLPFPLYRRCQRWRMRRRRRQRSRRRRLANGLPDRCDIQQLCVFRLDE